MRADLACDHSVRRKLDLPGSGRHAVPADGACRTLLAPPPAAGSDQQKTEVAEVLHLQQTASKERLQQVVRHDRHEGSELWLPTLGPIGFDLSKLTAAAEMLDAVLRERYAAADVIKVYHGGRWPWTFDDNIGLRRGPQEWLQGPFLSQRPWHSGLRAGQCSGPSDAEQGPDHHGSRRGLCREPDVLRRSFA